MGRVRPPSGRISSHRDFGDHTTRLGFRQTQQRRCTVGALSNSGDGALGLRGRSVVPMGTPSTLPVSAEPRVTSDFEFDVRVLVIDDRHDRRQLMGHVVEQGGQSVIVVGYGDSPASALDAVDRLRANAVLLEMQPPFAQVLDAISDLRYHHPALRIVVCSFHQDPRTQRAALARGADAYLLKPFSPRDLHPLLQSPKQNSSRQS
jgi:CheY-like chemotaxis protein